MMALISRKEKKAINTEGTENSEWRSEFICMNLLKVTEIKENFIYWNSTCISLTPQDPLFQIAQVGQSSLWV